MNLGSFWNCPNQFKKGLRSFHVSVERKERKKKKEKSSESSLSRLRHGCRKTLRTILQIPRSEFAFCIAPFLHPHHRHSAIYFVSLSNRPHRRTSTQTLSNSLDKRLRFTVNTYIYIYIRREGKKRETSFPVRSPTYSHVTVARRVRRNTLTKRFFTGIPSNDRLWMHRITGWASIVQRRASLTAM